MSAVEGSLYAIGSYSGRRMSAAIVVDGSRLTQTPEPEVPDPQEGLIDPNLPGFDINPQPAPETLEQSWKERMGLA